MRHSRYLYPGKWKHSGVWDQEVKSITSARSSLKLLLFSILVQIFSHSMLTVNYSGKKAYRWCRTSMWLLDWSLFTLWGEEREWVWDDSHTYLQQIRLSCPEKQSANDPSLCANSNPCLQTPAGNFSASCILGAARFTSPDCTTSSEHWKKSASCARAHIPIPVISRLHFALLVLIGTLLDRCRH